MSVVICSRSARSFSTNAQFVFFNGTKLDSEVSWDNTEENLKNPSHPTVPVKWGEQTKDEMGSVTLQVYPASESELATLRRDYQQHVAGIATKRIMREPGLMSKIRELLGGGQ